MVCDEYRTVIETKTRGECNPQSPGVKPGETQKDQLSRYLAALADNAPTSRTLNQTHWHGFLTDGEVWWGYEWDEVNQETVPMPAVAAWRVDSPEGLLNFFKQYLCPQSRAGKLPPPKNLLDDVFLPFLDDVQALQRVMERKRFYKTKIELWAKVLAGSGIAPDEEESLSRAETFARHTVLVAGSRILFVLLENPKAKAETFIAAVDDGFPSWVVETQKGRNLIIQLARHLSQYEWRTMTRDVLKDVYHGFIKREVRKEFGEYYTPDWLASWVVENVLSEEWMDKSIQAAQSVLNTKGRQEQLPREFGVLDPSCGSGTFLFHAACRIHARIRQRFPDSLDRSREILSLLIHGIDVHPIAVEMSRATLAMALPELPARSRKRKDFPLQIFLGDAMQSNQDSEIFNAESVEIRSPGGQSIHIPKSLVLHAQGIRLVDKLFHRARDGESVRFPEIPAKDRKVLETAVQNLKHVIDTEGNHVWNWYLYNTIGPLRLSERKVGCMVGNPPWLVANDTPDGGRKKTIGRIRQDYGIKVTGSLSAKGDLASVFSARVTDLYLAEGGFFAYVLPGSALINQTWAPWRSGNWGKCRVDLDRAWDLDEIDPPPFAHAPNGTCTVFGCRAAKPSSFETIYQWKGSYEDPTVKKKSPRESQPSEYLERFRRGAVCQPGSLFLTLEDPYHRLSDTKIVTVQTKAATKEPWRGTERVAKVEREVLMPILRSQELFAFNAVPHAWLIVPRSEAGAHILDLENKDFQRLWPCTRRYWMEAQKTYLEHRAPTAGTTLSENLNYKNTLSRQLELAKQKEGKVKVFYNKSGKHLRAARGSTDLLADDKLYYLIARNEKEALFLVGILNAECMQESWKESKTSKLHYDKSPWRHVPVPRYVQKNPLHRKIASAALKAEKNPDASRSELEEWVRELLPDYAS